MTLVDQELFTYTRNKRISIIKAYIFLIDRIVIRN